MYNCQHTECICFRKYRASCSLDREEEIFLWDRFKIKCPIKIDSNDTRDYNIIIKEFLNYRELLKQIYTIRGYK